MKLYIMNTQWLMDKEKYKEFSCDLPFDGAEKTAATKLTKRKIEIASGRVLLRYALWNKGLDTAEIKLLFTSSGKPYVNAGICFGISHQDGITAVATSSFDIGLDVQNIKKYNKRTAEGIMNEKEIEFIEKSMDKDKAFSKLWSVKEAYAKADGKGIGKWLREKDFSDILLSSKENTMSQDKEWFFYTDEYNDAYITLCHKEKTIPEIIFC